MEKSDYVQLDKRGRSGTRKDLRNWVLQRYIQLGQEAVSHPDVNSGHLFQVREIAVGLLVKKGRRVSLFARVILIVS